jgi:hypothetical protein
MGGDGTDSVRYVCQTLISPFVRSTQASQFARQVAPARDSQSSDNQQAKVVTFVRAAANRDNTHLATAKRYTRAVRGVQIHRFCSDSRSQRQFSNRDLPPCGSPAATHTAGLGLERRAIASADRDAITGGSSGSPGPGPLPKQCVARDHRCSALLRGSAEARGIRRGRLAAGRHHR